MNENNMAMNKKRPYKISTDVQYVNNDSISHNIINADLGLFHGKLGMTIFYYHLFRFTSDKKWEILAEELLDDLFMEIQTCSLSTDFEYGLTGIGWGIEYLVKNEFVDANTDEVLESIDDKVFHKIVANDAWNIGLSSGLLGYISYVLTRLRSTNNPTTQYLQKQLLIELINKLAEAVDSQKINFNEPDSFDILWDVPLLLIVLEQCLNINLYNSKIIQILKEIEAEVLTLLPQKHSNRAYLLLGLEKIAVKISSKRWKASAELLSQTIDLKEILSNEFTRRNVTLRTGKGGIALVLHLFTKLAVSSKLSFGIQDFQYTIREELNFEQWLNSGKGGISKTDLLLGEFGLHLAYILSNTPIKLTV
ncbi:hypothetical protein EYV94_15365 [Puteibacter caeruleilacunae]|nr:hypothetical protein EYV94_15365 [Puteibacter caeruleilacunae]